MDRSVLRSTLLALLSLGLAACAAEQPELDLDRAELLAAPEDTENRTWSVGVCGSPSNTDPAAGEIGACLKKRCSGTLIAPDLVLTAQHCLNEAQFADGVPFCEAPFAAPFAAERMSVTLGPSNLVGNPTWLEVDEVIVPPGTTTFCRGDLALLVLADPIPAAEATPAEVDLLQNLAETRPAGMAMVSRGAIDWTFDSVTGDTLTIDPGDLRRRVLEDIPLLCAEDEVSCEVPDSSDPSGTFVLPPENVVFARAGAQGDSGGAFLDQQRFDAGVPSVIAVDTMVTNDEQGLLNSTIGVRVETYAELIIATARGAAEAGGYPLPAWADRGEGADGGGDGGEDKADQVDGDEGGCAAAGGAPDGLLAGLGLGLVLATRRRRR